MRHCPRPVWQLVWLLAVATLWGCNESQTTSTTPATDPSASFARVVLHLRHYLRQLESGPSAAIEDGAYTDIRHSREVTDQQFKPPTEKGGEYRGEITVTTKWIYSFRPSTETEEEQPQEKGGSAPQSKPDASEESDASGEIEVLDPSVIADLPHSAPRDLGSLIPKALSDADEEVQTFHVVFRDNRWELVPQPLQPIEPGVEASGLADVNTNEAVEEAVKLALKRQ